MRFKEFSGEWERCKIGKILKIKSGKDQKAVEKTNGKYNIYGTGGIIGKTDAFLYDKESIGIGRKGTIDRPFYFNQPFWTVDTLFYSEIKKDHCVKFIYYIFETINWKMYDESTGVPSLSSSTIESIGVYVSNKKEQQKISDFLTLIDKRIETQMKIIEEYKSLINGIREKVFNNYCGKIIKLCEVLSEYCEKNIKNNLIPIAVGKYGIRQRSEIYTKELSKDLSKNKVVSKNTLIIGMGTKQIDIGILLDDITYCVSPAYTTYKIANINAFYLNELLVKNNSLLSKKYMIISARQGKSVNKKELLQHTLVAHNAQKQIKIVTLFQHLYKNLKEKEKLLDCFQKEKTYLLNNLFI